MTTFRAARGTRDLLPTETPRWSALERLADDLATRCRLAPGVAYADIAAAVDPAVRGWAQVCAPCIAVAALLAREDS